ncbi:hypothetical protein RFW18_02085 [Metabacillus idriensis]|uniref:hypothetical protein n=1 Tax=Metabacillus idriensis TaxID=324768 RepID=UPI00281293EA|nr:hypothetical protein [Metabacillus idriensis]MDR0136520.1 hypothetical protein [Metabacillus idriensis]
MTHSLAKPKWGLFAALVLLIAGSNAAIYRFPFMQPVPQGAALGSLLDFLIVIPLLTYLFILRKRYSLTYLVPVILAGYGFARFLIPAQQMEAFSFIPWLLFACEALVLLAEIFILILFFKKLPRIIGDYKMNTNHPFFFPKAKAAFEKHLPSNRLMDIVFTEISIFYYAFFNWRKKAPQHGGVYFTAHHQTSVIALNIMLIHAIALETAGFHFLLHSFSPLLSWVLLILNSYGVLFILADLQAIRLTPYTLTEDSLYLQAGITKRVTIPLHLIKEIRDNDLPEKLTGDQEKTVLDLSLPDFIKEKPAIKIVLTEAVTAELMYGFKKKADVILLNADEARRFMSDVSAKINRA